MLSIYKGKFKPMFNWDNYYFLSKSHFIQVEILKILVIKHENKKLMNKPTTKEQFIKPLCEHLEITYTTG